MPLRWIEDQTIGSALGQLGNTYERGGSTQAQAMRLGIEMEKQRREMLKQQELQRQQEQTANAMVDLQGLDATNRSGAGWAYGREPGFQGPATEAEGGANQLALDERLAAAKKTMSERVMRLGATSGFDAASKAYPLFAAGQNLQYGAPQYGTPEYSDRQALLQGHLDPNAPTPDQRRVLLTQYALRVSRGETLPPADAQRASQFLQEQEAPETKFEGGKIFTVAKPLDPTLSALKAHVMQSIGAAPPAGGPAATPATPSPPGVSPAAAAPAAAPAGVPALPAGAPPTAAPPAAQGAPGAGPRGMALPGNVTYGGEYQPQTTTDSMAHRSQAVALASQSRKTIEGLLQDGYVPSGWANTTNELVGNMYGGRKLAGYLDRAELAGGKGDASRFQEWDGAQRAWVEQVLRLASGAAIGPNEFRNYYAMFIPDANDTPQSQANKLQRMRNWEGVVGQSNTVNDALNMLSTISGKDDPALERLKVKVMEAGTGNKLINDVAAPAGAAPAEAPAQAAAPNAGPPGAPQNYDDIDRLLGLTR